MKSYYLLFLLCSFNLFAQKNSGWNNNQDIPRWAIKAFTARELDRNYTITYQLYPSFLRGDFDGDKRKDVALLVAEQSSKKLGIAIIHGKHPQALRYHIEILGAGEKLGEAGDNLKWVTLWNMIKSNAAELKPMNLPQPGGDIIKVSQKEERSGIIFWNGREYTWRPVRKKQ